MTGIDFGTSESARPPSQAGVLDLAQYTLEALRSDRELVLYRGPGTHSEASRASILLLSPVSEHPSRSTLSSMQHEYSLRTDLDPAYVVRPLALVETKGRTALVLEDPSGTPLDRLLRGPMEIVQFLRLAIAGARPLPAGIPSFHRRLRLAGNIRSRCSSTICSGSMPVRWICSEIY